MKAPCQASGVLVIATLLLLLLLTVVVVLLLYQASRHCSTCW